MDATTNPYNFIERGNPPDGGTCLSQSHIRAQLQREIPARLDVCINATYAKVQRELVVKDCMQCGEPFKVEKYKAPLVWECRTCRGVGGGIRGEVTRFSENSRRNLMRKLNRVKKDVSKVNFVTLTFPDAYFKNVTNPEDWKHCLRLFEWKFRRQFPDGSFVWRLEVVDRKSGEHIGTNYPHFHLLVFNVPTGLLKSFVITAWNEIAGNGDENHLKVLQHKKTVTPVVNRKHVMGYASKAVGAVMSSELAKDLQANGRHVGRWWGIANKEVFSQFMDIPEEYEMTDRDAVEFFRLFRRKIGLTGRSPRSLVCYWDGEQLNRDILRIVTGSPGKWCFTATGRDYNEPFWKFAYRTELWIPQLAGV